jgi:hypothetical protein
MAEIEILLPTVQYGNVKVRATPEELGLHGIDNSYELGVAAAVYLNLFSQGFKTGAKVDVSAPVSAPESEVDRVIDETLKNAQKLVQDGLGATELGEVDQAVADLATTESTPPWNSTVDSKPKPWESGETAPKAVVSEDW